MRLTASTLALVHSSVARADAAPWDGDPSAGIFGLSHDELLASEWVHEDALCVKVSLEVRRTEHFGHKEVVRDAPRALSQSRVEVPAETLRGDFLALLESGEVTSTVTTVTRSPSTTTEAEPDAIRSTTPASGKSRQATSETAPPPST